MEQQKKHPPVCADFPHMIHGGDYNPEQWRDTPEIWQEDMRLMKLAGCNEMSVGIFAWAVLEPEEGKFDFSFLDAAMDNVYQAGGRVILATPSGARPHWLADKYPEVLRMNASRTRALFGARHNHCFTSPVYRAKTAGINRRLAERYQDHPALMAWHISNEYGGECHCPLCQQAFRDWLKEKYQGDLEQLNHAWWADFWSHRYTSWEQIESPSPIGEMAVHGHTLDWKRFVTAQTTDFMRNEIAAVKAVTPDIPVTTNLMGFFPGLDYWKMKDELDFISWDSYPDWHSPKQEWEMAAQIAMRHDLNRSLKQKPFFLMESTPSLVNWKLVNKLKRPGMHKLSSLQAVAHGSDSVQYFQWRKSRGSSEKLHGAVVDHCGHEHTRVFRDVAEVGALLQKLDGVVGTMPVSETALIYDWENRWAIDALQGLNENRRYEETCAKHYQPFWRRGISVDVLDRSQDISRYKLVVAPMLYMADAATIGRLVDYVKAGGTLVCTYLTGQVNENDLCWLGGFPGGKLKEVFGLWAEELDSLYPGEQNHAVTPSGESYPVQDYCELVHLEGAEALAVYRDDFYAGMPAVCVHSYGKGKAYYIACRDTGELTDTLYGKIADDLQLARALPNLPEGVTAHMRSGGGESYLFIENYNAHPTAVMLDGAYRNLETDEMLQGEIAIEAYGILVLQKS